MKTCRICGETKENVFFYKLKHFSQYYSQRVIWCRECQQMYIQMYKLEQKIEELKQKQFSHVVVFL